MCAPTLKRFGSNCNRKYFYFYFFTLKYFFAGRFLLRPWGICSFHFSPHIVHIFQVMRSNFIKNPFCYFSISSLNSKSPISPIICVNLHENMQNIFFFMCNIKKSLVFSAYFSPYPPFGRARFRWATRYYDISSLLFYASRLARHDRAGSSLGSRLEGSKPLFPGSKGLRLEI